MAKNSNNLFYFMFLSVLTLTAQPSSAGVFNLQRFVNNGSFAIGLEPDLQFTTKVSPGINAKYTHGISELSNVQVTLGTGGGAKRFRLGGAVTFDFFPDVEGQPGIGVAGQALYYRDSYDGYFELSAIPYIHKTFGTKGNEFDPFFAFPIAILFDSGRYKLPLTLAFGLSYKNIEKLRYFLELGVGVSNSESYVSGGITYYNE
jgi:hypothetical protein